MRVSLKGATGAMAACSGAGLSASEAARAKLPGRSRDAIANTATGKHARPNKVTHSQGRSGGGGRYRSPIAQKSYEIPETLNGALGSNQLNSKPPLYTAGVTQIHRVAPASFFAGSNTGWICLS